MKTKALFLLLIGILLVNCDNNSTDDSPEMPEENDGVLIKTIVENFDGETYTATFTYSGNQLQRIEESDGYSYRYEYNDADQPIRAEHFDGNILKEFITFEYNSDGTLAQYTLFFENEGDLSGTAVRSVVSYRNNEVLKTTFRGDFNSQTELVNENEVYVTLDGTQIVRDDLDDVYEYDNQNGVYKNIAGIEVLSIFATGENGYYFYGNTNNVTKITYSTDLDGSEGIDSYEYSYNENGYPTSGVLSSDYESDGMIDEIANFQFTYQ